MVVGAEQQMSELLDLVVERVRSRLEPDRAEIATTFIRSFYANVPPDDIRHTVPDNLYGAALAIMGLASSRESGKPKIRVYNPHLEEHGWKASHSVIEIINDDMPFLVDSVTAALQENNFIVHIVIHPIVHVRRNKAGQLTHLYAEEAVGGADTTASPCKTVAHLLRRCALGTRAGGGPRRRRG